MKLLTAGFTSIILLGLLAACEKVTSYIDRDCEAHPYQYKSINSSKNHYITFLRLRDDPEDLRFFVLETSRVVFDPEIYLKEEATGYTISITHSDDLITVDRMDLPLPFDSSRSVYREQYTYDPDQGLLAFSSAGQRFELISCEGFYSRDFRQRYGLR